MLETIYWILAILVMTILLGMIIYDLLDRIETNKQFRKINEKIIEKIESEEN